MGAEQFDEGVLCAVGILVLVDQDISEPCLVGGAPVGVRGQDLHGKNEQVIERHRVVRAKRRFEIGVHRRRGPAQRVMSQSRVLRG